MTVSPLQDDDVIESVDPAVVYGGPQPEPVVVREGPAWDPAVREAAPGADSQEATAAATETAGPPTAAATETAGPPTAAANEAASGSTVPATGTPAGATAAAPGLLAVYGQYDPEHAIAVVDGEPLDAEGTAQWIRENTSWQAGQPVALLMPAVASPRPEKDTVFAEQVADLLGAPVVASRGALEDAAAWTAIAPEEQPPEQEAEEQDPARGEILPEPSPHQAPWYMERGALGAAAIVTVHPWADPAALDLAARQAARAALRPEDGPALRTGLRDALKDVLATKSKETWQQLLNRGRTLVLDGRLVWLRPVPAALVPAVQPEEGDVEVFGAGYATTTTSLQREHEVEKGIDAAMLSVLSIASSVASAFLPVVPRLTASVANTRSSGWKRTVVVGRKLEAKKQTRFDGGVRVLVFVDGVERGDVPVSPGRLALDVPSDLANADAPRPDAEVAFAGGGSRRRRPGAAREVLNAIDLIPVAASLQRRLLGAGLPAPAVLAAVDKVHDLLNEQTVLDRSRPFGGNGIVTEKVSVPAGRNAAGLPRSFEAHFVIRGSIERLQYLGDVTAKIREDSGSTLHITQGRHSTSKAAIGAGFDLTGLHNPEDHSKASSRAPMLTVTLGDARDTGHRLVEQSGGQTVLKQKGLLSRYLADQAVTVEIRSTTHTVEPVREEVDSEVAVPRSDAPDFERRLLGAVRTPALRAAGQSDDGPVSAQPHVRALLREAALPLPASAYRRPARLDLPLPAPHPREPLAPATRRGLGFGRLIALPGAELVHDQLRAKLVELDAARTGGRGADWSQADLDLVNWYGRPTLETDLAALMYGIDHTVTVGGRDYQLFAQAHVRERIGDEPESYPMTVDVRGLYSAQVSGHRGGKWETKAGAGASLQRPLGKVVRFQFFSLRGEGSYEQDHGHDLGGTVKSGWRARTRGDVDEHVYEVVYELAVRPAGGPTERWWIDRPDPAPAEAWWVPRPGDTVARVVVPHEHVPAEPIDRQTLELAGRTEELLFWPDDDVVDFGVGGASGVTPAFFALPELPRMAAEMYARANGLPARWAEDRFNWPDALKDMGTPSALADHFDTEAGTGRVIDLPTGVDGRKQAFRLRLRGYRPRPLSPAESAELEHYAQGGVDHKRHRGHGWGAGPEAAAGPLIHVGHGLLSRSGGDQEKSGAGEEGEQHEKPFMSVGAHFQAKADWAWKRQKALEQTGVSVSRAVYGGTQYGFRMDPVFEVTLLRWKGSSLTSTSRYLRVGHGLDTLVPERLVHDLGLAALAGLAPLETPSPRVPRHVHPALLPGTGYPERLRGGDVLDWIKTTLRHHGVLRTEKKDGVERANLPLHELEASFGNEALRAQYTMLLSDAGVVRWLPLPLPGAFGSTRYLGIKVTAQVLPHTSDRPRPEVKLTLRAHGQDVPSRTKSRETRYGGGVEGHVQGGKDTGLGGLEGGAGYRHATERSAEDAEKVQKIFRVNPDESHEFEHPLVFTVHLAVSTELPEAVAVALRTTRAGLLHGADLLRYGREMADLWYQARPLARSDEARMAGALRVLVPAHLVQEGPAPRLEPVHGTGAAWHLAPITPDLSSPDRNRTPTTPREKLAHALHPFAFPGAAAVHRWAALAAAPFRPPADLSADGAWRIPGLDFSTVRGLRYQNFTSAAMLLPNILELLAHVYEAPVGRDDVVTRGTGKGNLRAGDRTALVGMNIRRAEVIGPKDGAVFKARRYVQMDEETVDTVKNSGGFFYSLGPQAAGGEPGEEAFLAMLPAEVSFDDSTEYEGRRDGIEMDNRIETRRFRYYSFDLELQFQGPRGILRVQAPGGLYGMLPVQKEPDATGTYHLADGLEEALPDIFGRAVTEPPVSARREVTRPSPADA